ncbi:hypothetical protein L0668_01460 [Paraglaciecola aquimarina]|uniref:Uncharacterized protein n=1 Tax=Paraglaciecola algarum TaxID=3050085 RepID=A0ABS9D2A6_9ALTE|nr:hypothetical protein [Paraglaciecola sp. G1-23]MCF2946759.1 hypothetical protein [Paraglaciecola sp. G1-23]
MYRNNIAKYESELLNQDSIVAPDHIDKLSAAIVGFKIELTDWQGDEK